MKRHPIHAGNFKKFCIGLLAAVLLFTAFLTFQLQYLRFDYDFEKFFPLDDPESDFFFSYRQKFESDNDFLLMAIENDPTIFEPGFLQKVDRLTHKIGELEYVRFVQSVTNQQETFLYNGGATGSRPYIDSTFANLEEDSARIYNHPELINTFVAKDARSLCIFIRHNDYLSKRKSDSLVESLNTLLKNYHFDRVRIAGRTIGQKYYIEKMSFEMQLFVRLSFILIIAFLYIAFRSLWGILLPLTVILFSMIWIVGLMGLFREPINLLLVTLPSIMFVVSMSDVIHLVSRYLDALRTGASKYMSLRIALREVGMSTLLTSVTTAIGFFSLYFVRVQPIQIFGIVTGIGVLIAFVLTIALLPALVYLSPDPKYIYRQQNGHFWKKYLARWFTTIMRKRRSVLWICLAGTAVVASGIFFIDTNNYLMDDLKDSEPMKADFNYLDEHYGGVRPFEMAVILKDTSATFWDRDILLEIDKVENYVEKTYGADIRLSLVQSIRLLNKASHLNDTAFSTIPASQRKINRFRMPLRIAEQGKFYRSIVDSSETILRINGSVPDHGNHFFREKNRALYAFIRDSIDTSRLEFKVTGTAHLFDKNMRYLSQSLVKGLSISILIVALIMGLLYRSLSMVIISIIPNILPLLCVAGLMGFFGIDLKISTSIVFVIAFGIAVDDTIHFLGKFRFELNKGRSKIYALKRAYLTTGKAMILTSLILCAGFLLLILSSFLGTFFMGLMLCLTLLVAVLLDMTLLPVLILLFYHPKRRSNAG